jgi:hypothetical protein
MAEKSQAEAATQTPATAGGKDQKSEVSTQTSETAAATATETETTTAPGSTTTPSPEEKPQVIIGRSRAVGVDDYAKAKEDALKPKPTTEAQPTQQAQAAAAETTTGETAPPAETTTGETAPAGETTTGEAATTTTTAAEPEGDDDVKIPDRIRLGGLKDADKAHIAAAKAIALAEGISFADAIIRVSGKTAPAGTSGTTGGTPQSGAATEETLRTPEQIQADIIAAKAEKKKAADDLDTGKMYEADEKIDTLRDELTKVERAQAARAAVEETQFEQQVASAKTKAVQFYPAAANKERPSEIDWNSPLGKKTIEISKRLEDQGNELVYQADAPLKIMQMAANELGIAPADPAKPAVTKPATPPAQSSTSTATRPPAVRQTAVVRSTQPAATPASGAARTTQQGNGSNGVEVDKIRTVADYEKAKELLVPGRR